MVTIAPRVVVAAAVEVVETTLPGWTRDPGKTLITPALPVIGERIVS